MSVTRDAYLRAVDLMRREGEVTERTFATHGAAPYLLATLSVRVAHDDVAISAARLARLAVSTGAYLTMRVHDSEAVIVLQVSLDLPTQDLDAHVDAGDCHVCRRAPVDAAWSPACSEQCWQALRVRR